VALGFLGKLKAGLSRTTRAIAGGLGRIVGLGRSEREDALETLEEVLVTADMGIQTALRLRQEIETRIDRGEIQGRTAAALIAPIRDELKRLMPKRAAEPVVASEPPTVVMVVGVNGTGKTTSVGKLAKYLSLGAGAGGEKKKVILAAADTFRAAATEQLAIWAERAGVELVKHGHGADPAAVVHDAAEAAVARKADILLVDTAGRLHTRENLMRELEKIRRVASRIVPGAPHEVLLVLDATTGQNAVSQAKKFTESVGLTGLFLAKLDGTAKGGVVVAIWNEVKVPVKYVGVGEGIDDILRFDPETFVDALFPEDLMEDSDA
jgi:fused signal recognition particle receptor